MIQLQRSIAIDNLIREIEMGNLPSIDQHGARIIFREQLDDADPTKCAVCDVPLIGRQEHFCSGHWDYAIVDVTLDQPYHRVLTSLADWLRENLLHPTISHHRHHWLGVAKGAHKCEVCGCTTDGSEVLESHSELWNKQHTVCDDHASFQPRVQVDDPEDAD